MAQVVYILCALTSLSCAATLLRAYRRNGVRLLFWSAVCFSGLTVTNVLLFLDRVIFPELDLMPLRSVVTLLSLACLLYGLAFESA